MKYLIPVIFGIAIGALIGFNLKKCSETSECQAQKESNRAYKGIISIQSDQNSALGIIRILNYDDGINKEVSIGIPYFNKKGEYSNGDTVLFNTYKQGEFTFAKIEDLPRNTDFFNYSNFDNLIDLHNLEPHGNQAHKKFHWQNNKGRFTDTNQRQYILLQGTDQINGTTKIHLAMPTNLYDENISTNTRIFYHVENEIIVNNIHYDIVTSWGKTGSEAHKYN